MNHRLKNRVSVCLGLVMLLGTSTWPVRAEVEIKSSSRRYLETAEAVARWIRGTTIDTPKGRVWPNDVEGAGNPSASLGTGVAGCTLFFLELSAATASNAYLQDARQGADYLLASLPEKLEVKTAPLENGFYTGVAGVGFTLNEVYKSTRMTKYREGARRCLALLHQAVRREGSTALWTDFNDLLFGNSGNGLFLLYAAREMHHPESGRLAIQVGRGLIARAVKEGGGLNWKFREGAPYVLPNFSHGTAGICYFLATLYQVTGEKEFLDAALAGAGYLKAIARTDGETFLVPYGFPNPEWAGLYDIGWAHGPAGTARLFFRLWQITKDRRWFDLVLACARGITRSGLPGEPNERGGFGKQPFKIDMRFGAAGVADFFLYLHRVTKNQRDLNYAKLLIDEILKKATVDNHGFRWIYPQYEFMEKPGTRAAFTGYFYGGAGFGLLLLHAESLGRGRRLKLQLPDNPFPGFHRF
jgi:lantibiotic modifying enzyme